MSAESAREAKPPNLPANIGSLEFWDVPEDGYRLQAEVIVESPIDDVFAFFSDAGNLESLTPSWLNFQIVTALPIQMRLGALLDYKIRLHMIPISWRTEIACWQPPHKFVDQQLRGPYKRWWHEHTFEDLGDGLTLIRDDVHYIPRGGKWLHRWFVKPDLEKIFKFRQQQLARRFRVCGRDHNQSHSETSSLVSSALISGSMHCSVSRCGSFVRGRKRA